MRGPFPLQLAMFPEQVMAVVASVVASVTVVGVLEEAEVLLLHPTPLATPASLQCSVLSCLRY